MTTSYGKLVSFTKAFTVCLDSQCAEDLFTAGLESGAGDDDSNLDNGESTEVVPYKERLMAVKYKFELDEESMTELRFVFERLRRTASGEFIVVQNLSSVYKYLFSTFVWMDG
jgi:hypothetical protein